MKTKSLPDDSYAEMRAEKTWHCVPPPSYVTRDDARHRRRKSAEAWASAPAL